MKRTLLSLCLLLVWPNFSLPSLPARAQATDTHTTTLALKGLHAPVSARRDGRVQTFERQRGCVGVGRLRSRRQRWQRKIGPDEQQAEAEQRSFHCVGVFARVLSQAFSSSGLNGNTIEQ